MMNNLLTDDLWNMIEPLLPERKPRRLWYPGRKPIDERKVMTALIFMMKTGLPWHMLPKEVGCGCGRTVRRRLELWSEAGVFDKLHALLLQRLNMADKLDVSRVLIDAGHVKAPKGGEATGPSPVDRRKIGSKHPVMTATNGAPLSVVTTKANRLDVTQMLPLLDSFKPIRGRVERPRRHPNYVQADKAYASKIHEQELRRRHITPIISQRGRQHGSGLAKSRWHVESAISWLHQN